jgi:hypothetical protein
MIGFVKALTRVSIIIGIFFLSNLLVFFLKGVELCKEKLPDSLSLLHLEKVFSIYSSKIPSNLHKEKQSKK